MIQRYIRYSLALVLLSFAVSLRAQVSTLYFMKNVSVRHELNPAFQPLSNVYIDLPVIPSLYISMGNNSLSLSDVVYPVRQPNGTYKTTWFKHSQQGIDDLHSSLQDVTRIHFENELGLLAFGFRVKNSYITLGAKQRSFSGIYLPKDLFTLPLKGSGTDGKEFNMDHLALNASTYTELALGYALEINDRLSVGAKAKMLLGQINLSLDVERFRVNVSREQWNIDLNAQANMTIPYAEYVESADGKNIRKIDIRDPENVSDYVDLLMKPEGRGAAVDLGVAYKLLNNHLTLSASVVDLGFIKWNDTHTANMPIDVNFNYDGLKLQVDNGNITDDKGNSDWFDGYADALEDSIRYTTSHNAYRTSIATKLLIGAEYSMLNEKISIGLLSRNTFIDKTVFKEMTASLNLLPATWFNTSVSYSLLNGRSSSLGLGVSGRIGPFSLYVAGDYVPTRYTKELVPYELQTTNLQLGFILNFGNGNKRNRDDDRDGVRNAWDRCPETPAGVAVNRRGCPVDAAADVDIDADIIAPILPVADSVLIDSIVIDSAVIDSIAIDSAVIDSIAIDSIVVDTVIIDTVVVNESEITAAIEELLLQAQQIITFAPGNDTIPSTAFPVLDSIAIVMQNHPACRLDIYGHTDSADNPADNQALSERRAAAVKTYLEAKGVAADRLTTQGFGHTQPIVPDEAGNPLNSRIEFAVKIETSVEISIQQTN
jgi:outer membrane protein OmpA-like peptidoglycan-associated protein